MIKRFAAAISACRAATLLITEDYLLARTRWPDQADEGGWDLGTDLAYLRSLVDYWREDFDWRRVESRLHASRIS